MTRKIAPTDSVIALSSLGMNAHFAAMQSCWSSPVYSVAVPSSEHAGSMGLSIKEAFALVDYNSLASPHTGSSFSVFGGAGGVGAGGVSEYEDYQATDGFPVVSCYAGWVQQDTPPSVLYWLATIFVPAHTQYVVDVMLRDLTSSGTGNVNPASLPTTMSNSDIGATTFNNASASPIRVQWNGSLDLNTYSPVAGAFTPGHVYRASLRITVTQSPNTGGLGGMIEHGFIGASYL